MSTAYRPVVGYPQYLVGDDGTVISTTREIADGRGNKRTIKGRKLKPVPTGLGYLGVNLLTDGIQKRHLIHRLVLTSFRGACPPGMEACHNDGIRTNNHLENLRWDTPSSNAKDRIKHGTQYRHRSTTPNCIRGHSLELTQNLVPSKVKIGKRYCLACSRALSFIRHNPELRPEIQRIADERYQAILANTFI